MHGEIPEASVYFHSLLFYFIKNLHLVVCTVGRLADETEKRRTLMVGMKTVKESSTKGINIIILQFIELFIFLLTYSRRCGCPGFGGHGVSYPQTLSVGTTSITSND